MLFCKINNLLQDCFLQYESFYYLYLKYWTKFYDITYIFDKYIVKQKLCLNCHIYDFYIKPFD